MKEQTEAVIAMQLYIDDHIADNPDIGDLAKISGYSPWHARRLFTQYVGISPALYLRKLRLKKAALKLRDNSLTVLEAALDAGFDSEDGFRRAFLNEFGVNPADFTKRRIPIPLFTPYSISYQFKNLSPEERKQNMPIQNVFLSVVEKPARKIILKRSETADNYWDYCKEVGCDVWGILSSIKSLTGEPVCLWLPKAYVSPGTGVYVQGAEVEPDYDGPVPEGFEMIDLPASSYLMFQGPPFEEEHFEEAIGNLWQAEKEYNPSPLGYEWSDANPRIQLEPIGTRGYIELLPIRKI